MSRIIKPPFWAANRAECAPEYRGFWDGLLTGGPMLTRSLRSVVGNNHLDLTTDDPSWATSGEVRRVYDGNDADRRASAEINGLSAFSIMVRFRVNSFSAVDAMMAWGNSSTATPMLNYRVVVGTTGQVGLFLRDDSNVTVYSQSVEAGIDDGALHTAVLALDLAASTAPLFVDGTQYTLTRVNAPGTITLNQFALGALWRTSVGNALDGEISMWAVWNRRLSNDKARSLSNNPFGMFTRARRISVVVPAAVEDTLAWDQEGFRFYDDDAVEASSTPLAAQDTDISRAQETTTRLRVLVNASGDQDSSAMQLEYRKVGDPEWLTVAAP